MREKVRVIWLIGVDRIDGEGTRSRASEQTVGSERIRADDKLFDT